MLEILPIKDNELDVLLKNNNIQNEEGIIAFSAAENGVDAGHIILAQNKDNCEIVNIKMNDPDDAYLLDGLVRASAVIAAQRGYTGVYYQNNNYKNPSAAVGLFGFLLIAALLRRSLHRLTGPARPLIYLSLRPHLRWSGNRSQCMQRSLAIFCSLQRQTRIGDKFG